MNYLHWNEQTITDFSDKTVSDAYNTGYVFTRLGKGAMQQTRSIRINLSKFKPSSENRRVVKKAHLELTSLEVPLADYNFTIGKLGKDFYENKFGAGIMSAQKIKEMLTDSTKSNFNMVLTYIKKPTEGLSEDLSEGAKATEKERPASKPERVSSESSPVGFSICYTNKNILHYSYPFYDLTASKDTGLGMMTLAIEYAQERGLKYVYLGSLQRPTDTYKLQFSGIEWFDGTSWSNDLGEVKKLLSETSVK